MTKIIRSFFTKTTFRQFGLGLAGLFVLALAVPQQGAAQEQQLGSFAVGHFTRIINVTGTLGEKRPVNVHLWYPAATSGDCNSSGNSDENGNGQGCSASMYTSRLNGIPLLPQWDALSWKIGSTASFESFSISEAGPLPVIIFSHGATRNAIDYAYTLEALASFGFIVAAPDHVNDTQDDVRIDYINSQAKSIVIPCFDGLPSPCEITDRVKAENFGKDPLVPCPQNSVITSTTVSILESLNDRVRDVGAIIDALPAWFGDRADTSRVGIMGHSRGTVTALAAAGGSTCWGFNAEPRVKAIMGLAIGGTTSGTFGANVQDVTVPALIVAGTLDKASPASISEAAFNMLGTPPTEKAFVLIPNAKHRHFVSGACAQTQSSGAIAQANTRAILDLQTFSSLVTFPPPATGDAMDICGFDTFTSPTDITSLVEQLTRPPNGGIGSGFIVTPSNVPTTGLTSDAVKDEVIGLPLASSAKHCSRNSHNSLSIDVDRGSPIRSVKVRR